MLTLPETYFRISELTAANEASSLYGFVFSGAINYTHPPIHYGSVSEWPFGFIIYYGEDERLESVVRRKKNKRKTGDEHLANPRT